jgi:hypothetical protein
MIWCERSLAGICPAKEGGWQAEGGMGLRQKRRASMTAFLFKHRRAWRTRLTAHFGVVLKNHVNRIWYAI